MLNNKPPVNPENSFTMDEKLQLVNEGLMAPEEIGVSSIEEGRALHILPDLEKKPTFGTTLMFRAGCVPLELRALWAMQESKIAPFNKEAWMEDNKNIFPCQAEIHCGTAFGKFGQTFTDPVLGLISMMRQAADMLEAKYNEPEAIEAQVEVNQLTDVSAEAPPIEQ